jgi:hypothetical protein
LAGRSRKRSGRRQASAARPRPTARPAPPAAPPAPPAAAAPRATRAGRSEARNAAVRATLTPLAPGERPWSLKIAALIALLIGGGDLIAVLINGKFSVGNAHAGPSGVILFSVLMLVCAVGMWQLRYWAVLGFQAILAFVVLFFSLLLLRADNLLAVVTGVVVVGGGGFLFYKLVRVLSRLQMPKPPGRA